MERKNITHPCLELFYLNKHRVYQKKVNWHENIKWVHYISSRCMGKQLQDPVRLEAKSRFFEKAMSSQKTLNLCIH
jgi:hypothetical protein